MGFKRTDIGIIPDDWEISNLSNYCNQIVDGTHFTPHYVHEGIPFLSVENVTGNNFSNTKFITNEEHERLIKRCKPAKGDILMTRIGSLGITKYLDWDIEASIYVSLVLLRPKNINLGKFLYCYTKSNQFVKDVEKRSLVNATPQKINMGDIGKVPIPLPPIPEQQAIAEALSDVDALIAAQEALIAKKRAIKQGVMQELLTGKRRLPGFSGKWVEKNLGEIIEVLTDYTANGSFESLRNNVNYYSEPNFAVLVRTTDLDKDKFEPERFTDKKGYDFLKKTSLFGGEIIIANVGSIGKVFKVPYYTMPMTLGPNTYLLKFNRVINEKYIYQWLLTDEFVKKLLSKIGSTTLQAINKDNLRSIELSYPKSLEEQKNIAIILDDIDIEIFSLEKKLEKIKDLKIGMMQELLTGRVRLTGA